MTRLQKLSVGAFAGSLGLLALAMILHDKNPTAPADTVLGFYEREGIKITFQGCTQNYAGCPAYDFTSRERMSISLALDSISTDVLRRSGIRRIIPIPAGPDRVESITGDALLVYSSLPYDRRNLEASGIIKQIVDTITVRGTGSQLPLTADGSLSHNAALGGNAVVGPNAVVISPTNEPLAYTPVLNEGNMGHTGLRYNDTHDVSAISSKNPTER